MEEDTTTKTETKYQRQSRLKKAKQERDIESAIIRQHELAAKNRKNAEIWAAMDDSALRAKRIKELVADTKRQNYLRWVAALTAQKKYKEKNNGRIS